MAKTKKQLHEELRLKFLMEYAEWLKEKGEDVLRTKSNEISIPTLDSEGNDEYMVVTFKVPTGSRDDGEAYDGYAMAQQYADNVAEKAEKAKIEAEKKAKKIARDKAQREAKAKAKAEHNGEGA